MTTVHTIPIPIPYPVQWVNAYYIEDSTPSLIDTGINTEDALRALQAALKAVGSELSSVQRVILTHGHIDHMGLAGTVAEAGGSEVFMHAWDESKASVVADEKVRATRKELLLFMADAGMPDRLSTELTDEIIERLHALMSPLRKVTTLFGGETFHFDTMDLRVVHLPGHTPGSICLHNADLGHLYSGDGLIEEITYNPATDNREGDDGQAYSSLTAYVHSLKQADGLTISEVYPGHGNSYSNPGEKIRQLHEFHDLRKREILRILGEEKADTATTPGLTRFQLATRLFPAMNGIEIYHRICAVHAHLEALEAESKVASTRESFGRCYEIV